MPVSLEYGEVISSGSKGLDIGNREIVEVTAGVPTDQSLDQLSGTCPMMRVLRKSYLEGVEAVAFADDLSLIVRAISEYELKHKAEIVIEIVEKLDGGKWSHTGKTQNGDSGPERS
ncbi:hypothetical protein JTB14_031146 [Gonioctena quinquepunctata]|nr:hypothetical protein JTB14_031146 [Gonioctena quinquepunctata]